MGFTKLDERILQSSIMAEDPKTFKIWIALLAACRENGIAYVSTTYLQAICHMTDLAVNRAIERLLSPDPASRSITEEGRRIRKVEGGFEIINYVVYRDISLKDAEAERKRLYRQKMKGCPDTPGRCPDSSASASVSASSLSFNKNLKVWEGITEKDKAGWREAYPACDIDVELARMKEWILSNPAKGKKSNYRRFITSWLSRAQDRGGSGPGGDNGGRRKPDPPHVGKYIPPTPAEKEFEKKLLVEFEQAKKKYMTAKGYKNEDDIPFEEFETFSMFKARRIREMGKLSQGGKP